MENSAGFDESKERNEQEFTNLDLTPLEHILIGSSTYVNGKSFNFETFAQQFMEGSLPEDIYKPLSMQKDSIEAIEKKRNQKGELEGMFGFLNYEDEILSQYVPYMKIDNLIDRSDGIIDAGWVMGLKENGKEIKDAGVLSHLAINPEFEKFFHLEPIEHTHEKMLTLKQGPKSEPPSTE